ncbi:MAG TPA: adaptor protein MecA [Firmicutes bacterium]|nr:adaptor protein MecA [Bacillota bacterium]
MNIEIISPLQLRIEMSADELKRYGLSYKDLDYNDGITRAFLLELLKTANKENGFKYLCFSKMLIEVFPAPGCGCIIYFTCVEEKAQNKKAKLRLKRNKVKPYIYEFLNSTDLLDAMKAAAKIYNQSDTPIDSALYLIDGKYRLVLYPTGDCAKDVIFLLDEYGMKTDGTPAAAAYLSEHGKVLAENHAVEKIGRFLI